MKRCRWADGQSCRGVVQCWYRAVQRCCAGVQWYRAAEVVQKWWRGVAGAEVHRTKQCRCRVAVLWYHRCRQGAEVQFWGVVQV